MNNRSYFLSHYYRPNQQLSLKRNILQAKFLDHSDNWKSAERAKSVILYGIDSESFGEAQITIACLDGTKLEISKSFLFQLSPFLQDILYSKMEIETIILPGMCDLYTLLALRVLLSGDEVKVDLTSDFDFETHFKAIGLNVEKLETDKDYEIKPMILIKQERGFHRFRLYRPGNTSKQSSWQIVYFVRDCENGEEVLSQLLQEYSVQVEDLNEEIDELTSQPHGKLEINIESVLNWKPRSFLLLDNIQSDVKTLSIRTVFNETSRMIKVANVFGQWFEVESSQIAKVSYLMNNIINNHKNLHEIILPPVFDPVGLILLRQMLNGVQYGILTKDVESFKKMLSSIDCAIVEPDENGYYTQLKIPYVAMRHYNTMMTLFCFCEPSKKIEQKPIKELFELEYPIFSYKAENVATKKNLETNLDDNHILTHHEGDEFRSIKLYTKTGNYKKFRKRKLMRWSPTLAEAFADLPDFQNMMMGQDLEDETLEMLKNMLSEKEQTIQGRFFTHYQKQFGYLDMNLQVVDEHSDQIDVQILAFPEEGRMLRLILNYKYHYDI